MPKHECYGCTKRAVGCRSTCESWIAYEKEKAKDDKEKRELSAYRFQEYLKEYNMYIKDCKNDGTKPMCSSLYFEQLRKHDYKYKNMMN